MWKSPLITLTVLKDISLSVEDGRRDRFPSSAHLVLVNRALCCATNTGNYGQW